jgi:hypothetical protein
LICASKIAFNLSPTVPFGFNAAFIIVLKDTVMQSIAEKLGLVSASFPKATTYYSRKKTLLPRTLSITSYTFFLMTSWTRSQKVKIPGRRQQAALVGLE